MDWSHDANPGKTIRYFGGADRSEDLNTLDNFFARFHFTISSLTYPSIEHAFQSLKFLRASQSTTEADPLGCADWAEKIRLADTPQLAKQLGRQRRLAREFLDAWKRELGEEVMIQCQRERFEQNQKAKRILMGLEEDLLVEKVDDDPTWDDRIWGCGKEYKGENKMGLILMKLRKEFATKA